MPVVPVIDLFAGPGGLGEGFSSVAGGMNFSIVLSIEKDRNAHRTLRLRALYRLLKDAGSLDEYYDYLRGKLSWKQLVETPSVRSAYEVADNEAKLHELGPDTVKETYRAIREALRDADPDNWVLIGGPPCQAYSLVGRSRNRNNTDFEDDERHFLYKEYLGVLKEFRPPVFVMENVKGLLSSTSRGRGMFDAILRDLTDTGTEQYTIRSVTVGGSHDELRPIDYVVRAEEHGIPQARHRVILLGIRSDLASQVSGFPLLTKSGEDEGVTVHDALHDLPRFRGRLSSDDSLQHWLQVLNEAVTIVQGSPAHSSDRNLIQQMRASIRSGLRHPAEAGNFIAQAPLARAPNNQAARDYFEFIDDSRMQGVLHHSPRSHMAADLQRYFFASAFAKVHGISPKLPDFPEHLQPQHANLDRKVVPFTDRFRVQLKKRAASTVVSHISKDGHYFIHPDPAQARSLTVREAARLQTFPDNYYFEGSRTAQYSQVGNAVPPLLARKIGEIVASILAGADTGSNIATKGDQGSASRSQRLSVGIGNQLMDSVIGEDS